MTEFLLNWLMATPGYATPLLLASLGLIINERAGVLNLGAEGMMVCGALAAAMVAVGLGSPSAGMLAALLAGVGMSLLFGFATVILRSNQVITGLIIVALGTGLTGIFGRTYTSLTLPGFGPLDWAWLANLPAIGPFLMRQNLLTCIAFALVPVVWYVLFRTLTGLRLRSVGEDPATADAAGERVLIIRLLAVLVGGAFCGAAGGYLALAASQIWVEGMVAGRGWIAIGLVIFARWRPGLALLGALFFGAIEALIPRIQATGADVPIYLMMMLPYLATLGVLWLAALRSGQGGTGPAALGLPYIRQDRH